MLASAMYVSSADFSHDAPPPRESDERSHFSQASSSCGTTSSLIQDVARVMESRLHLKPGRGCIVGEGLTTVDLGIFVDGKQIAIQLDQSPATISTPEGTGPSTARLFAERKTQQRVLQSFGWVVASLMDKEWHDAGSDDHVKVHLIVEAVNKALGKEDDSQGEHHYHHAGCGCSH
ncbi:hypothetical protein CEUSTIGMA_g10150.t1 [Chlamydomonas eustigma]|uniref:RAP domain-containing protein n=1 Tax=Chlamydomonas eustigma TaxID=1157962 RepID=A0A250XI20_9CHLO|nr:hypothetical protein CEUSTIGMA_g10150.t1 [Chlamydomonas eustigma]|eukprot:GAX82724.1 hypothetical protein CEUSTIGMA_g10150.t1 [Chlamydomonas eustigma]